MKPFKIPDLKAPRFKIGANNIIVTKKLFKKFIEKYPEYKGKINESGFKKIINEHGLLLRELVINNRDGIELHQRLGHIFIGTCHPARRTNVAYDISKKYKKELINRNYESDNFIAKIFYTNYGTRFNFKNGELWEFKGHRKFTRAVSENYPKNWKKYIFIDKTRKLSIIYRKNIFQMAVAKTDEHLLKYYNEFEID